MRKEAEYRNRHLKNAPMAHWGSLIREKPSITVRKVGNNLKVLIPCHFVN